MEKHFVASKISFVLCFNLKKRKKRKHIKFFLNDNINYVTCSERFLALKDLVLQQNSMFILKTNNYKQSLYLYIIAQNRA